MTDCN